MKKLWIFMLTLALVLAACGGTDQGAGGDVENVDTAGEDADTSGDVPVAPASDAEAEATFDPDGDGVPASGDPADSPASAEDSTVDDTTPAPDAGEAEETSEAEGEEAIVE